MSTFSQEDSQFLSYLRSLSILVIVFGHIGLFWVYEPYSEFLQVFIPIFFFISGAVSYGSYCRSNSVSEYYKKRFVRLLIPYYLLAFAQFVIFFYVNHGVTSLCFSDVIRWFMIIPNNAIMPFSIGHVWFLHTLFVLILISPLYFYLFSLNKKYAFLFITFPVLISFLQIFIDISSAMIIFHNNLFKPVVHSAFFMFGVLFFHSICFDKKSSLVFLFFCSLFISVTLLRYLPIDVNYNFHVYAPDLYYVSGSFAAIAIALLWKRVLVKGVAAFHLQSFFSFIHRHTYSIYLVHVPVLVLWFYFFALDESAKRTISYGLLKMLFVVVGTFLLAVPFTWLSSFLINNIEVLFGKTGMEK